MAVVELESPFKEIWRKGYLRYSKKDGRGRVDLVNSDYDRTTISYARYLKSVELGYEIPPGYEVDHKDSNCGNDSSNNLQVLTEEEHRKKTSEECKGRSYVVLSCTNCGKLFERELRNTAVRKGYTNSFCGRPCMGKYMRNKQLGLV